MSKQLNNPVYIFVALDCEAKALIKHFGLKKLANKHVFSIYSNIEISVIVTGIGKIAMASAVAYTMAISQREQTPVLVNLGIAGHKSLELGQLLLALKIVDVETGKRYYPQLLACNEYHACQVNTYSTPNTDYQDGCLNEMEASAFYEVAVRFSTSELIHCIKIVSDNEISLLENINAGVVEQWVEKNIDDISSLIRHWQSLSQYGNQEIQAAVLGNYQNITEQWHFSVTAGLKLKALLKRWHLLTENKFFQVKMEDFNSSKEVLKKLENELDLLEYYL